MKNILIVDDDVYIGNMIEELLRQEGYGVMRAYSGTEALLVLAGERPDLVLLDRMLPGLDGEKILPKMRGIPVIIVSARTDTAEKADLLLGGAADYITKPFDSRELLARVAVQLRQTDAAGQENLLEFADISIYTDAHLVRVKETPVHLTRTEYAILRLLMEHPSQVVTRSVLLDSISRYSADGVESSLKIHISNLRKKLKEAGGRDYIEAVWGIGYKMRKEE